MATYSTYDERKLLVEKYPYVLSNRFVVYGVRYVDLRVLILNYKQTFKNERRITFQTNPLVSERNSTIEKPLLSEISSRFGYTEKGYPRFEERLAYFIPNASYLLTSVKVQVPFLYVSERKGIINTSPFTQRLCCFPLRFSSEISAHYEAYSSSFVSSPVVSVGIERFSERNGIFNIGSSTQRVVVFPIGGWFSERNCFIQANEYGLVSSPKVETSIGNISNERFVSIKLKAPFTERISTFTVNPYSDRIVVFPPVRFSSERLGISQISQYTLIDTSLIIQAKLKYSERFGVFKAILYATDRIGFVEQRETIFFKERKVSSATDLQLVESSQDTSVGKVIVETDVEVHGENTYAISKIGEYSDRKDVYFLYSAGDKVKVSPVSKLRGTLFTYEDSKKRKRLSVAKFSIVVGVKHTSEITATFKVED